MNYIWDDFKERSNLKNHGLVFDEAKTIWNDDLALETFDSAHSQDEDRFVRLGLSASGHLLVVIYCEPEGADAIRIISARRATLRERREYEEGI